MSALAPVVKGWCPGALRPMPSGDGLLARVRLAAGRLSLDQAEALGRLARDCGNGTIEISSRANLQLRGVEKTKLAELQSRLADLGLIDADAGIERARNIVASPLSDVDPEAILDVAPLVAALEARLAVDESLRALPGKFGFVIDAGGRWPLGDVEADVRFEAFLAPEGVQLAVRLDAEPAMSAIVAARDLPDAAARIARAFLTLAGSAPDPPRRMRALVRRDGPAAVFAAAGLAADANLAAARKASPRDSVGVLALGGCAGLGAAPPFGRMQAAAFAALARSARAGGASGLRLTPWRTIVVVGLERSRAPALAKELDALGFIVACDDPRLSVVACPGAPACAHAESDTHAAAHQLANLLPRAGVMLHVSGCAKGCARAAPAPLTLVARPEGYDLVVDGRASDAPTHRGLRFEHAAELVKSLSRGVAA